MTLDVVSGFRFEIDSSSIQRIVPPNPSERFEGIDFSPCGNILAIATSETNKVLLFKRTLGGRFEDSPFQDIGRSPHALDYPHDVSFCRSGLLAVAQRTGAIAIYEKNGSSETYDPEPAFEISGLQSKLAFSDGVAFVPPKNHYLAACNLHLGTILFFRRISRSPVVFDETPEFQLKHSSVFHPDGLAFSSCGRWLATANHGKGSVSIFQRRNSGRKLIYGPEPVTVIRDPQLWYPHSVAFTPKTNHLIVTNAGANYFSVYAPRPYYFGMQWSESPVTKVIAHEDETFRQINTANKTEGGPKGVAIRHNKLAVCSPQIGVKIYSFRERRGWFVRKLQRLKPESLQRVDRLVRFDMTNQHTADEWHELENHPQYGFFRWTGPSQRATIYLPIVFDRDLTVRIHILSSLSDEAINTFKLSIHDQEITYELQHFTQGRFLVIAQLVHASIRSKPTKRFGITLQIANTIRPLDIGLNQDSRSLGLAVNWVELDPDG